MAYSSSKGSLVKWSIKGSSVDNDTFIPILKNFGNGESLYFTNNLF